MRKIFLSVVVLALACASAFAGSISLDLKVIKFDIKGDVSAVGLINVLGKTAPQVLNGVETSIATIPLKGGAKLDISLGAVTGPVMTGTPFGSIGYNWDAVASPFLTKIGLDTLRAGIGVGYNFNMEDADWKNHVIGGLKISAALLNL